MIIIVDCLRNANGVFFLISNMIFSSSQSTGDLLTVVCDRIARSFNRSGATRALALDTSMAFDKGLALFPFFLSDTQLQMVLDGNSS